uniref:substrate-binding domain-containing protein n=1 Tax=Frankia sp. Cr1 TaxID=3073931 RepID=UPI002AD39E49
MIRHRRAFATLALASAVILLGAAACSGSGGKESEQSNSGTASGQVADTPRLKIAMVTHQSSGDTFWDIVRKGAQAAAAKDNIQLIYSSDPDGGKQATLIQNAIDSKVDGIAVTLSHPEALKGAVQ